MEQVIGGPRRIAADRCLFLHGQRLSSGEAKEQTLTRQATGQKMLRAQFLLGRPLPLSVEAPTPLSER